MSQPYKLLSPKRTLLGVVTFPDHLEERLWAQYRQSGFATVRFHVTSAQERRRSFMAPDPGETYELPDYRVGCLRMMRSWDYGCECVELYGVTIAEFEQLPDCTFAPSMAYLETLLRRE